MQVRSCPRCEIPIRTLARYKNQVQQANKDLSSIQQRFFQHQRIQEYSELQFLIQQLQKQKLVGTGVFQDLSDFLKRASLLLDKPASRHFNLMFANTVEILELQMRSITNICSALECCQNVDNSYILELRPVVTFIMDIVQEKNGQFGMQVAHDVSCEVLRLYHMAYGLQRLTQSSNTDEKSKIQQFMKHMHQPKCYSKEMELATTNILKQWDIYSIPKLEIHIKVPIQPLNELWKKCPDQHINFNAYIPFTELQACNKCNIELFDTKCPKFKVAVQHMSVDKKEIKPISLPKNTKGNSQNGNRLSSKFGRNPQSFNNQPYNYPPHFGKLVRNPPYFENQFGRARPPHF
ncbi:hypothetical protein B566_EDAN001231, partial [Ephemera danica]